MTETDTTGYTPEQIAEHKRLVTMRKQAMAQPDGEIIEDWAEVVNRMPTNVWCRVTTRRTRSAYQQLVSRLRNRFDDLHSRARTNPDTNMVEVWLFKQTDDHEIEHWEYNAPVLGPPHRLYDAPYGENPVEIDL